MGLSRDAPSYPIINTGSWRAVAGLLAAGISPQLLLQSLRGRFDRGRLDLDQTDLAQLMADGMIHTSFL
jgi:hypothetical protein